MKCRGKHGTTVQEICRVVSRFPHYISCYIAESRFPLGQCRNHKPVVKNLQKLPLTNTAQIKICNPAILRKTGQCDQSWACVIFYYASTSKRHVVLPDASRVTAIFVRHVHHLKKI